MGNLQHLPTLSFAAVGDKGYYALSDLPSHFQVKTIFTYPQESSSFGVSEFLIMARRLNADLQVGRHPQFVEVSDHLVFAIGWQFLIKNPPPNLVVLHDSLLPSFRGFSPTVAALSAGSRKLGVTAFLPGTWIDDGTVLAHSAIDIPDGVIPTIGKAFQLLRPCYQEVISQVTSSFPALHGNKIEVDQGTFSLWLDEYDFLIDWNRPAQAVLAHIRSRSAPYSGATTFDLNDNFYKITEASLGPNLTFANPSAGKTIRGEGDSILVACSTGTVKLESLENEAGERIGLPRWRTRFSGIEASQLLMKRHLESKATNSKSTGH